MREHKKEFAISLLHGCRNREFIGLLTELPIPQTAPNISSPFHIFV
ncbi:hypothetical protein MGWOODY_XGa2669 [hydrothermal vent metagenome]|uniref:Uncharacterized protein n=1 Tax=hydrothermal vent metagenome TaxID=652676 RepID=A0A160TTL4_9ZZZZ